MPLEELEKKLYRPEEPKRPLEPSYRKFRPVVEEPTTEEEKAAKEWLEEAKKPPVFTPKQKKISKIFFMTISDGSIRVIFLYRFEMVFKDMTSSLPLNGI